jgi:hypothetical protein
MMMNFENCNVINGCLFGAIIVIVLMIVFKRESFNTSVAIRSQVGDATNLDTVNGASGSFPGDIYNCAQPILLTQPDDAWTWTDSKGYNASATGSSAVGVVQLDGIEHMGGRLSNADLVIVANQMSVTTASSIQDWERQGLVKRINGAIDAWNRAAVISGTAQKSHIEAFIQNNRAFETMSNQQVVFNKSDKILNNADGFRINPDPEHMKRDKETMARNKEQMGNMSDSTLVAIAQGNNPMDFAIVETLRAGIKQ